MSNIRRLVAAACIAATSLVATSTAVVAAPTTATSLLDCQFGVDQIFDIQWNPGTFEVEGLQAANMTRPYASVAPTGQLPLGTLDADDYFQFFASTSNVGTYGLRQFASSGTLKRVMHDTGDFVALGEGMLFYTGGGFYGTLFSTQLSAAMVGR